jgi:hypothetical protein
MAADSANQKVFVPLAGVLKLQDKVRQFEKAIDDSKGDGDSAALLRARHHGLSFAVEVLGLPIEVRSYTR